MDDDAVFSLPVGLIDEGKWAPLKGHMSYEAKQTLYRSYDGVRVKRPCVIEGILETLGDNNTLAAFINALWKSVRDGNSVNLGDHEERDRNVLVLAEIYLQCRGTAISVQEVQVGISSLIEAVAWTAGRMIYAYHVGVLIHDMTKIAEAYGIGLDDTSVVREIPKGRYNRTECEIPGISTDFVEISPNRGSSYLFLVDYDLYMF